MFATVIQWLLFAQLSVPNLVLSQTTYPPDLDLDVILGISPGTTTIDYDQADFDEQAYGPIYGGDTVVKSGSSKSTGNKGSPGARASSKSSGRTRFMLMRSDSDDNIDGSILSDSGADNNQMSSENNVVLGGASGGTSGAISGEVMDPDPDLDAYVSNMGDSGKSSRRISSTEVTDKPKRSRGSGEKTSTQASSNEVTAASSNEVTDASSNEVTGTLHKTKNGGSKSTRQGSSYEVTDKPNKTKGGRDKSSGEVSSSEVTGKPKKSKDMTSAQPTEKPKPSEKNGSSTGSKTSKKSAPSNLTFSLCFETSVSSQASQTDFCRFANAVHGVCKAYFSNICSGSMDSDQYKIGESESYASEESMDSEWRDYSLDSVDYDSLTASLESFGSSEMSDNEMKEVLKIVKGLCSNVCSAARNSKGTATRSDSTVESAESSTSSAIMGDADLSDNESDEIGVDASDTENRINSDSDERETEDSDGVRRGAKTDSRMSKEKKKTKSPQGSNGRNGNRKTKTRGKNRKTNYEKDNESESDSD